MADTNNLPECPVELTLKLIGNKWKVLIIRDLLTGTKRFNELKKSLDGVSQKVLTSNLRSMEDDGLIERKVYPEVPPKVEYTLIFVLSSTISLTIAPIIYCSVIGFVAKFITLSLI